MLEAIGPGASLAGGRGRTRAAWGEGRGRWSGACVPGPGGARSGLPSAWSPQWVLGKAELPARWASQALLGEGHRGLGAPLHRWQGWSLVLVHSAQPGAQGSCCASSTPAPTRGEATVAFILEHVSGRLPEAGWGLFPRPGCPSTVPRKSGGA